MIYTQVHIGIFTRCFRQGISTVCPIEPRVNILILSLPDLLHTLMCRIQPILRWLKRQVPIWLERLVLIVVKSYRGIDFGLQVDSSSSVQLEWCRLVVVIGVGFAGIEVFSFQVVSVCVYQTIERKRIYVMLCGGHSASSYCFFQ